MGLTADLVVCGVDALLVRDFEGDDNDLLGVSARQFLQRSRSIWVTAGRENMRAIGGVSLSQCQPNAAICPSYENLLHHPSLVVCLQIDFRTDGIVDHPVQRTLGMFVRPDDHLTGLTGDDDAIRDALIAIFDQPCQCGEVQIP